MVLSENILRLTWTFCIFLLDLPALAFGGVCSVLGESWWHILVYLVHDVLMGVPDNTNCTKAYVIQCSGLLSLCAHVREQTLHHGQENA